MKSFCKEMQRNLLFNPHSDSSSPSTSALMIEKTRNQVLQLFDADPEHFDVVFTANATAAIKLVMDCFASRPYGFNYCYHRNCHTSLVGVREHAQQSRFLATDDETQHWLTHGNSSSSCREPDFRPTLFAYPVQSNMNGERLPLDWAGRIRSSSHHPNTYTLLDVAAYVSTTPLSLRCPAEAPDFTVMSFYKIFGFPDLGALLVRKDSAHILTHRKYFGGGTVEMTICGNEPWVAKKSSTIHARLEDGTVAIRSILALSCAIDTHPRLFGSMKDICTHTTWLATILYTQLSLLVHANGLPVCEIYKSLNSTYGHAQTQGATVCFNVRRSDGTWEGSFQVGKALRSRDVHVRAGSLCNPGGMATSLELSPADIKRAYYSGFRCNQPDDIRSGTPFGMVRVTLGAMSTLKDVRTFMKAMDELFVERDIVEPIKNYHVKWIRRKYSIRNLNTKAICMRVNHSI